MLSGSGNYWRSENKNEEASDTYVTSKEWATVRFSTGLFVANRHLLGVLFQYQRTSYSETNEDETNVSFNNNNTEKTGAGILYRYYVPIKNGRFAFFLHTEGLYLVAKSVDGSSSFTAPKLFSGTGFTAAFRPGIAYRLNKKFGLEASFGQFGYEVINYRSKDNANEPGFSNAAGTAGFTLSSLMVGVTFYLGGKED